MPWREKLAEIPTTEIDEAAIAEFQSEGQYVGVAVDLVIEVGSYAYIAANLFKNPAMHWSRNEAILGGQLVRLFKLLDALLDQTCKHRRETSIVIARLIFECIVNLRYMIANASDNLFNSYRSYSLQHELKLLKTIEENIVARGGDSLPIEDRMIRSINLSFQASALTKEDVDNHRQKNWSGLNLYERAERVGLDQAYLAAFGGGSHSVHGNWQDMLEYHLEKLDDDSYRPNLDWHMPRPQILETLAMLVADALIDYVTYFTEGNATEFVERLEDLQDRAHQISELHEAFLEKGVSDK
jgi:hypothetical protein